jgi:hypothetical protein
MTVSGHEPENLVVTGDIDALAETLTILGDTETVRRLVQCDIELRSGQEVSAADLAAALRKRGD